VSDVLTQTALLRPVVIPDDDPRVAYYLVDTEEAALNFKRKKWERLKADEGALEDHIPEVVVSLHAPRSGRRQPLSQPISFRCVRHYEVTNKRELNAEYLLTIDDGAAQPGSVEEGLAPPREAAAYYKPLSNVQTMKVRRPRVSRISSSRLV
jgi:hypothetical protein